MDPHQASCEHHGFFRTPMSFGGSEARAASASHPDRPVVSLAWGVCQTSNLEHRTSRQHSDIVHVMNCVRTVTPRNDTASREPHHNWRLGEHVFFNVDGTTKLHSRKAVVECATALFASEDEKEQKDAEDDEKERRRQAVEAKKLEGSCNRNHPKHRLMRVCVASDEQKRKALERMREEKEKKDREDAIDEEKALAERREARERALKLAAEARQKAHSRSRWW